MPLTNQAEVGRYLGSPCQCKGSLEEKKVSVIRAIDSPKAKMSLYSFVKNCLPFTYAMAKRKRG